MTIRKSMERAIIGLRGQRINRTVAESQALLDIGGVNDNDERVISITGAPEAIKKARSLLWQAVRENVGLEGSSSKCYKCKGFSHLARECCEEEDNCYKCLGTGHIARN